MARQRPLVAVEPETLPDLRAATREAHEALTALRAAARDCHVARAELEQWWTETAKADIDAKITELVRARLESFRDDLKRHRDRALERIDHDMDEYWRLMLGVDAAGGRRKPDDPTIGELINSRILEPVDKLTTALAAHARALDDAERRLRLLEVARGAPS